MINEKVPTIRLLVSALVTLVAVLAVAPTSSAQSKSADSIELFRAVRSSNVTALRELIAEGAEVNAPDDQGRFLLGFAAVTDDLQMTRLLLDAGAEVDARSEPGGWTALLVATTSNQPEIARMLIEAGADVEPTTADGWSPLRMAARDGLVELVDVLVAAGSDIERRDAGGRRALSYAAAHGNREVVRLLIERGANSSAPDRRGVTPFMVAAHFGHVETARLLCPQGFYYTEDGVLIHTNSGARFEPTMAEFTRGNPVAFDEEGTDVGIGYRWAIDPANGIEATVYVYPTDAGRATRGLIREHFRQCEADIAAQHGSVHELMKNEYMWENLPGGKRFTTMGMYRLGDRPDALVSYLFLLGKNDWFIKYRVTYPASVHERRGVAASVPDFAAAFNYEAIE